MTIVAAQPTLAVYAAGSEVDVSPLEALLGEVRRTSAKILWLEHHISLLKAHELFGDDEIIDVDETELERQGKPRTGNIGTGMNYVQYMLQVERNKQTKSIKRRRGTHPAVALLLAERKHLAQVSIKALQIGIKLDKIDYSRKQADMIVNSMAKFAAKSGMDLADPNVSQRINDAIDEVLAEQGAT
jgi:hypothetical protein